MSTELRVTDPMSVPTYSDTALQRWLAAWLYDPRDVVFLRLTLKAVALMVPAMALMFWHFAWWQAPLFWGLQLGWLLPSIILMLHNTMHRPFFKRRAWLTHGHAYLMSSLFGIPTGYMEHHVAMHHVENNLPNDLSSTMKYDRDNFFHFLRYFTRFMLTSHVELTSYLVKHGRGRLAFRAMASDAVHVALMVGLGLLNWRATLVCFVVPYATVRFLMMMGNWGQHAFIDPERPGDSYVNSITCINSPYNHKAFNDGYHIGHHVKANRHWAQMPQDFLDSRQRYIQERCIVFENLDFFLVSLLLFAHRYDVLARRFVRLDGLERPDAEVMAFLKSRTRPFVIDQPVTAALPAA